MALPLPLPGQMDFSVSAANMVASNWAEYRGVDGRDYFYNKITKVSTYKKPDALRSPEELKLAWREYSTDAGRKYYYNVTTRENVWEMPAEYREFVERTKCAPLLVPFCVFS